MGEFHRAKSFCGIIRKRMRASGFENILAASELYGSNQIEGTRLSFEIDNFYNVFDFSTLKISPIVKALNIDFHGKFRDKVLFLFKLKTCKSYMSMLILLTFIF